MTTLALQLQRLALPGVNFEVELQKRPSLLFDSQKAATLDRDAFYGLGVNGFEGICSSDSSLHDEFARLFDESAKNMERTVLPNKENDVVDKIPRFLLRAAPFLLSRSAQKCLEWLIYRMKIHNFNMNDMLFSFLPYHNTKIFVRILQLFDSPSLEKVWCGLPTDVVSSRNMVLEKCLKDRGFFAQICNSVVKAIDAHDGVNTNNGALRPAVNLYTVYALETIFNLTKGQNEFLSTLMPFVVKGLESSVADFKAATYMIICLTSAKITLTEPVIVSLLRALSKNYLKDPQLECLMTIITLTQSQENAVNFPEECAQNLTEVPDILEHLETVENLCNIGQFLLLFMDRLAITASTEEASNSLFAATSSGNVLLSLVKAFPLSRASQKSMIRVLIEEALQNPRSDSPILKVMFAMHKKYPESFTDTVNTLGKVEKYGDRLKELLSTLLEVTGAEECFLPLLLNFDAPEPSFRASAVIVLGQMLSTDANLAKSNFVRQAIRERLIGENSADVVTALINVISSYPESFFYDKELACRTLVCVLLKSRGRMEWNEVSDAALEFFASEHFAPCSNEVAAVVSLIVCDTLLHKVCMSQKVVDVAVLQHGYFSAQNPWIVSLNWKKDVKAVINSMTKVLKENPGILANLKNASKMVTRVLHEFSLNSTAKQRIPFHFLLNHAICKTFLGDTNLDNFRMVRNVFLEVTRDIKGLVAFCCQNMKKNMEKGVLEAGENTSDFSSAFSVLVTAFARNCDDNWSINSTLKVLLVTLTEYLKLTKKSVKNIPDDSAYSQWNEMPSSDTEIDGLIFYRLVKRETLDLLLQCMPFMRFGLDSAVCEGLKKTMRLFLLEYFTSPEAVVQFLAPYWSTRYPAEVKVQALRFAGSIVEKNCKFDVSKLLETDCAVVPSLLIALSDHSHATRKMAAFFVSKIAGSGQKGTFFDVVQHLSQHLEVSTADPATLCEILASYFASKKGKTSVSKNLALENLVKRHVVCDVAPIEIRARLLQSLRKIDSKVICESLAPVLSHYLDICLSDKSLNRDQALFVTEGLMKIDAKYLPKGSVEDVFWKALNCEKKMCPDTNLEESPQSVVLKVVTKHFFANLDEKMQKELIHCLLIIAADNAAAVNGVAKVFKNVSLDLSIIAQELDTLLHGDTSFQPTPAKRKRTEKAASRSSIEWLKIVLLIEFLQEKKKITNTEALLAPLFQLLEMTMDSQSDDEAFDKIDYLKQLVLTLLLRIVQKLKCSLEGDKVLGEALKTMCKVQTIVHCVRSAETTQTQHHALLLLSELTNLFPEKVLDNIMAIFTFMGSHLLRQDDSYSFQVISKTMKVIVPALVKADRKTSASNTVLRIIHAFIDSLPDIPSHRKVVVLHELLDTLGGAEHLWLFILLLGNLFVRKPSSEENNNVPTDPDSKPHSRLSLQEIIDVCLSVCERESVEVVLRNLLKCSDFLLALPFDKEKVKGCDRISRVTLSIVEAKTLSTVQIRKLHIVTVTFFANIVEKNRESMAHLLRNSTGDQELGILLQKLYEKCLEQICKVMSYAESASANDSTKFSKTMASKCYSVMQLVNGVLPFAVSIGIFQKLLKKEGVFTKRKSLELLAERLASSSVSLGDAEVFSVARVSEKLAKLVLTSVQQTDDNESQEEDLLYYTALITLKVAVRNCGQLKPDAFVGALGTLCQVVSLPGIRDPQVSAAGFLCLAEMCLCLKAYCIPHLNDFVPVLLRTTCEKRTLENDSLLFSCVTVLHRLLESLPDFTSAYLEGIVDKVTTLMLLTRFFTEDNDESIVARIGTRLKVIVNILATKVPSRILLSVLGEVQKRDMGKTITRIKPLCSIVLKHVESMNRDKVLQSLMALSPLVHALLDFRALKSSDRDSAELVDDVEDLTTDITLAMMLKLPENSFRVFFFGLSDLETTKSTHDRSIVYYKLMLKLSKKMKGLFSLFAGAVIENAAMILRSTDKADRFELLKLVCSTLNSIFLHDTSGILTKERFELLSQPLIDMFEGAVSSSSGETLVRGSAIPLLGQVASSVGDDSCQKLLNYKILLKSRHSFVIVRRLSLVAVETVAQRLGGDYSTLLPESIPFLSELMEDDEEEVEKECHAVIRNLEKIVGEPLQKYFTE